MSEEKPFHIRTDDKDIYHVEVILESTQSELEALSKLLKSVKEEISERYGVPQARLKYRKILDKKVSPEGVVATLEISCDSLSSGKPVLKFCSAALPNGQSIDNMILMADVFPFDENGKKITKENLLATLKANNVGEEYIDFDAVSQSVNLAVGKGEIVEDALLARGVNPEFGVDARLEFSFEINPDRGALKQFLASRKANKGDVLCTKHARIIGRKPGSNLFGETVNPISGWDFQLIAGNGTRLSSDGSKIYADQDGVAIVRQDETKISALAYSKSFPREVQLRIDPVRTVESTKTVEIITKDSVEIQGSLKKNSNIITEGEVYVLGDVEPDAKIHAQDDIIVEGNVERGSLVSSKNIFAGGKVTESTLSAKGVVRVEGTVNNSRVYAENIEIDKIVGSTLVAAKRVVVRTVEQDEKDILSEIRVGIKGYQQMKIEENNEFLDYLNDDVMKMKSFFGNEIVDDLSYANTELMLLKFAKSASKSGGLSKDQWDASKKLIESIPSLKIMIGEKKIENLDLVKKLETDEELPGEVFIKEKFDCPVSIQINSVRTDVAPGDGGRFTLQNGQIRKEPL